MSNFTECQALLLEGKASLQSPTMKQICEYPCGFVTIWVAQFFLKIAKLLHIMVLRGPHAHDLLPRVWLLLVHTMYGCCVKAPLCLKQKFSFLSTTRTTRITRGTTSHNLVILQPRTNLGKRTFSYSATVLFNALEVDLKILAAHPLASPSALSSFSFSLKHKLRGLFLQNLNTVSRLEELCCHECRFLLKCRCFF